jgi:hypothetical protein
MSVSVASVFIRKYSWGGVLSPWSSSGRLALLGLFYCLLLSGCGSEKNIPLVLSIKDNLVTLKIDQVSLQYRSRQNVDNSTASGSILVGDEASQTLTLSRGEVTIQVVGKGWRSTINANGKSVVILGDAGKIQFGGKEHQLSDAQVINLD